MEKSLPHYKSASVGGVIKSPPCKKSPPFDIQWRKQANNGVVLQRENHVNEVKLEVLH